MSGWKVLCFEPVRERRDATDDEYSYDGYDNPNRAIYAEQYGSFRDRGHIWPADHIQKILVEQFGAKTDRKHGCVFAMMYGYDANWEQPLRETFLMWDKAAVIEANDTGDVGEVHVYDRTWDATRGSRQPWDTPGQALPTNLMADGNVIHETRHEAIGVAAKYSQTNIHYDSGSDAWVHSHAANSDSDTGRTKANCVYDLDVAYINGVWMVYTDHVWSSAQGRDYDDGRHPLYEISEGLGRHSPDLSLWKVDHYRERECRDGRPVGEKAAAYAQYEWNIHTRAGTPMGWDWDHTRAEPHSWRYKVCFDTGHSVEKESRRPHGSTYEIDAISEVEHRFKERHEAVGVAATLDRVHEDAWVEAIPVETNWAGGIDREFDPTAFPSYDPEKDRSERPDEYR